MSSEFTRQSQQVDLAARAYQANHPGTNYSSAVHAIIRQATEGHQQQINRAVNRYAQEHNGIVEKGWKVFEDASGNVVDIQVDGAGRSISQLNAIVTGLPKLTDGSVDSALAVKIVRQEFGDLGATAAGAFLHHKAMGILGTSHPQDGMDIKGAMQVAQQQNPSIAAVWNGSPMSEIALRQILWPLFREKQVDAPGPGEKSYARRASYEAIKRYEYTPSK